MRKMRDMLIGKIPRGSRKMMETTMDARGGSLGVPLFFTKINKAGNGKDRDG